MPKKKKELWLYGLSVYIFVKKKIKENVIFYIILCCIWLFNYQFFICYFLQVRIKERQEDPVQWVNISKF